VQNDRDGQDYFSLRVFGSNPMTGHIGRQAAVTEHLGYRRRISEILLHQARIAKGTLVYIARSPLALAYAPAA
jgi:hypothetical protein